MEPVTGGHLFVPPARHPAKRAGGTKSALFQKMRANWRGQAAIASGCRLPISVFWGRFRDGATDRLQAGSPGHHAPRLRHGADRIVDSAYGHTVDLAFLYHGH